MFKKLMATVGIGGAKVDTILLTHSLIPGGLLEAEIHIDAGDVEQHINGLDLALCTQMKVETDDDAQWQTHILQRWRVCEERTLSAGEQLIVPLSEPIHAETPVTELPLAHHQTRVWLTTGLDISLALDASDTDSLKVAPNPAMIACMQAMDTLGYDLFKADVEHGYLRGQQFQSQSGCYQELEYRPNQRSWLGVKEVELSFIAEEEYTHALVEIDRAFRGDGYHTLTLPQDVSAEAVQQQLQALLS
ncbi:sporulation control protein Spo0M [Bacterioplanes sanyensis]|uniref:Sporulation control protein Spo0M n=1 Tax=Bacterioplanes sanyensis TaxID=1249553 RepID=A0A222FJ91_9GAMM|nr:sporulation protein [Bacterioplanes sanyensis]ASP39107.1 sporulation control protein Spo0M [Bacterioplanes sanyensis]